MNSLEIIFEFVNLSILLSLGLLFWFCYYTTMNRRINEVIQEEREDYDNTILRLLGQKWV